MRWGHRIDAVIPPKIDRETIHQIIFDELLYGTVTAQSRAAFVEIIDKLAANGCDAVALVCTEIPMLVTPETSPPPTLDSTRLLAQAASDVAVGDQPVPTWRGSSQMTKAACLPLSHGPSFVIRVSSR